MQVKKDRMIKPAHWMRAITRQTFGKKCWVLGLLVVASTANTAIITGTSIAHNSNAQFANVSHLPYANPNAPKGGVLSLSAIGTFDSINKWIDVGTPVTGTDYLFESLMTGSLSEAFVQYPLLADKVTYDPDDPSWVIYHINPKAYFWDGAPVTADDVKASMDALLTRV